MNVWSVLGWIAGIEMSTLALLAVAYIIGRYFALDVPPDLRPLVRRKPR